MTVCDGDVQGSDTVVIGTLDVGAPNLQSIFERSRITLLCELPEVLLCVAIFWFCMMDDAFPSLVLFNV
jgi:hypothetical protein